MQKCVFIIDDDPIIRYFLRLLIERKTNLKVYDFDNGFAALRLLNKNPRLIICDYEMDSLNGIQVLERLLEEAPEIKTCMISSLNDKLIIDKAKALGADFFPKDDRLNEHILSQIEMVEMNAS